MQDIAFHRGWAFERQVAALYRILGANVEFEVVLAGSKIDLLITQEIATGKIIRTVVECKDYSRPIGVESVRAFGALASFLRGRQLIDGALLMTRSGATYQAREFAKSYGIEIVEFEEFVSHVGKKHYLIIQEENKLDEEYRSAINRPKRPKKIFVVMPFAQKFIDVYIIGIREVAETMKLIVERADDIEHNDEIVGVIQDKIRSCDIVVADLTDSNANVFYEVGYAHGVERATILICEEGGNIPFDVKSKNIILYPSIVELRPRLRNRIIETLRTSG